MGSLKHIKKTAFLLGGRPVATATSSLGVLATNADTPPVAKTTVSTHLFQALNVLAQLGLQNVRGDLRVLAGADVLLSVQEPLGDLELEGVLNNRNQAFDLIWLELTSALVNVDFSLLADQVGKAATHTLDGGQRKHDLLTPVNVGVEDTQNVLEIWAGDERHGCVQKLVYFHCWRAAACEAMGG